MVRAMLLRSHNPGGSARKEAISYTTTGCAVPWWREKCKAITIIQGLDPFMHQELFEVRQGARAGQRAGVVRRVGGRGPGSSKVSPSTRGPTSARPAGTQDHSKPTTPFSRRLNDVSQYLRWYAGCGLGIPNNPAHMPVGDCPSARSYEAQRGVRTRGAVHLR